MPLYNGLTGLHSNKYKCSARNSVLQYIDRITAADGHPLPIQIRRGDGKYVDACFDTENVIVLPACHSIPSLFEGYKQCTEQASNIIALNTFRDILFTECGTFMCPSELEVSVRHASFSVQLCAHLFNIN